jgi:hypothetical protein
MCWLVLTHKNPSIVRPSLWCLDGLKVKLSVFRQKYNKDAWKRRSTHS